MKKQSYLKNAVVLTSADFLLRVAGMGFRIYLVGALGDEGVGLFQLIMSFYAIFITLATAGISVASTRLITEELSRKSAGAKTMLCSLLWVAFSLGTIAGALQYLISGIAGRYWIGDERVVLSLKIVAFALPFMAVANVFRGVFMAKRRVQPNVYSQVVEQVLRISLTVWLLAQTVGLSLELRCAVILFGATIGEIISCALMMFFYKKEALQDFSVKKIEIPDAKKRIWEIVWPVTSGRVLTSALHAAENVLVPLCLAVYLVTLGGRSEALAQYGVLKGMVIPLLIFPMGLLGSLSTLLMPEITQAHVCGNKFQLERLINKMFVITMYSALFGALLFFVFSSWLGDILYKSDETGLYLKILAPMAPFMYLENMVTGALKGLGEQKATFKYSAIDSTCRIIAVILLLPHLGMLSFLYIMFVSNIYTCAMNTRRLFSTTKMKIRWAQWFIYPSLACGVVYYIGVYGLKFAQEKQISFSNSVVEFLAKHTCFFEFCDAKVALPWLEKISSFGLLSIVGFVMVAVYIAVALPLGLRGALSGGKTYKA